MMSIARRAGVQARVMAVAAGVAIVASGCTMCPDPYDYSGPVPNGSPPQNDFRARSNGILPLGAAPKPWPPLVKTEPENDPAPTLGTPDVGDTDDLQVTVADAVGVVAASGGEEDPAPSLVIAPVAEQDAAEESDTEAADAPEPIASARPAAKADRRGLPSLREASRWLRWR